MVNEACPPILKTVLDEKNFWVSKMLHLSSNISLYFDANHDDTLKIPIDFEDLCSRVF